jgi:GNAT superfamily N-acetyltransferase|tara:strand:- start:14756 stop:15124 length:369 start_codon:yes stop_codon:yes gene_type:complete
MKTGIPTFKRWLKESIDWESLNHKYNGDEFTHRLDFFNNSGAIGFIEWDRDSGEVEKIYVGDKIRRNGVGTYIWDTAEEWAEENQELPPEHSSRRSKDGDEFAKSMGGNIPSLTDDIDGWSS